MNTVTHEESQVLQSAVVSAGERLLIPLSRLRPSGRNVRKGPGLSIPELAASITRVGLLQNLTVIACRDGKHYEVVAGMRRLAALKRLVKQHLLDKDHEVLCLVVPDTSARLVSLTENVQREAMHPLDQFEAFAALVAEGRPVEDIAADFGVAPLVVQRRLKLANVSSRLLADYRAEGVTLEQLMALAITDDHAAQEAAFYDAPHWQRTPQALRDRLTLNEMDASRDALARFVGADAYEAAGGRVRRDLFADAQQGVYLTDSVLLETLARDRLGPVADQVRMEGWRWVDVAPRATHAELQAFQRARRTRREPGKAEAKRLARLQARQNEIQDRLDDEEAELSDDDEQALNEEVDQLGDELEAIEQGLITYAPEIRALAGAVVSVDHLGAVVVHRGLLREEQAKALQAQERRAAGESSDSAAPDGARPHTPSSLFPEKVVKRLSAHRTAALQAEVARHPAIALVVVVHRLALRVIMNSLYSDGSPVNINAVPQDGLDRHATDIAQSPALVGLQKVRQAWQDRLPADPDALFGELLGLPQQELLSLLAVCVAVTVDVVTSREAELPAALLARAVGLDMHDWWTPTAEGYFEQVSKARTLEAVQAFAPEHVHRLAKLKKGELAIEAGRLVVGTGWLPVMLRGEDVSATQAQKADSVAVADSSDVAGVEEGESAHAHAQA